jgi:hypothetical protein
MSLPTPENGKYAKIPCLGVKYNQLSSENFYLLSPVSLTPADKHLFATISENFRKKLKRSQWRTQGTGGTDLRKKHEVENLVSDSL